MGTVMYDPKTDPKYQKPYVDVDEWRERPMSDSSVLPFCYIHGGFEETGVKFLFCFPEASRYEGRFYQYLSPFPGPDEEVASVGRLGENDRIGFSLANGAYSVESNMGSSAQFGGQWVEKGIEPLQSTVHELEKDGQIHAEKDIKKRFGTQATLDITANGAKCAHIKAGEEVTFTLDAQLPEGAGEITEFVMAYEEAEGVTNKDRFPVEVPFERYIRDGVHGAVGTAGHIYDKPGTYFATARVLSKRHGDRDEIFFQIKNLDRVRIIVEQEKGGRS